MIQSAKRTISLLLALVQVISMLPANALAQEHTGVTFRAEPAQNAAQESQAQAAASAQSEMPSENGDIQLYINPRFEGRVDAAELCARVESARMHATPVSESDYVTVEEAIVLIRESM